MTVLYTEQAGGYDYRITQYEEDATSTTQNKVI